MVVDAVWWDPSLLDFPVKQEITGKFFVIDLNDTYIIPGGTWSVRGRSQIP